MDKSEVAIKCESTAYAMIKSACVEVNLLPDEVYRDNDVYIMCWHQIQWYAGFDEIDKIEQVMDELNTLTGPDAETKEGFGYKFVRIGESIDDLEIRANTYELDLDVVRRISIPEGFEKVNDVDYNFSS